jgi:hypothetical protein
MKRGFAAQFGERLKSLSPQQATGYFGIFTTAHRAVVPHFRFKKDLILYLNSSRAASSGEFKFKNKLKLSEQNTRENTSKILTLCGPVLMGIFLFFTPFSHTTAIKEICFYLSVFIVLILICFNKINFSFKSPLTLPFALFTIWAFIGLFLHYIKKTVSMIFMRIY